MNIYLKALMVLAAITFGTVSTSYAQQQGNYRVIATCVPVDVGHQRLIEIYNEGVVFNGSSSNGVITFLWINEDTGTWSITFYPEPGIGCMVAEGTNGQILETPYQPETPKGDTH